jgi:hypothetical protein
VAYQGVFSGGFSKFRILIRWLRMYFPRNWEFGSALSKLRNFGRVQTAPSVRHWYVVNSCVVIDSSRITGELVTRNCADTCCHRQEISGSQASRRCVTDRCHFLVAHSAYPSFRVSEPVVRTNRLTWLLASIDYLC